MLGEVLAVHDKPTVCTGAGVPVAVAVSVVVVVCALLVNVNVAVSEPATSGLYVIVNAVLFPAAMVAGSDRPLMTKRELLEVAPVTVTFAPLAVRVPDAVPLVPTTTLPTATGDGDTFNCPAAAAPVPLSATVRVGLDPSEVTVTVPLAAVAVCGAKVTVNVAAWPAPMVTGAVIPLKVKSVPAMPTFEIVRLEPPTFVSVSVSFCVVPVCTVPKFKLVGLAESVPGAAPVPDKAIEIFAFGASEVIASVPLALPVD